MLAGVTSVVFEAPLLPSMTSFKAVTKLHSLAGHTEWACLRRSIPCASAHNGKVKKASTGKGNAKKHETMAAITALGFFPQDDNEADAIAIWLYALGHRSPLEQSGFVRGLGIGHNQ
jgi:Holliday junction resolvasome RuvABC endonuclease subunit